MLTHDEERLSRTLAGSFNCGLGAADPECPNDTSCFCPGLSYAAGSIDCLAVFAMGCALTITTTRL